MPYKAPEQNVIELGPYKLNGRAVLAPMAGVTDLPFRKIARELGASTVTGEMTSAKPELRNSKKSLSRKADLSEPSPRIVQIAGADPLQMAEAAAYQRDQGADIIDINMGCPAKKVCKKAAGSALMQNEALVTAILRETVNAVDVPVSLKIRTGWDLENRNAPTIAKIAEDLGIQSLAVHGRSRACKFNGEAEYQTICSVVNAVDIPVFANGDINSSDKAQKVLRDTGAAGVMIGRGALGNPWIFHEINNLLNETNVTCGLFTGKSLKYMDTNRLEALILKHIEHIHRYYMQFDDRGSLSPEPVASHKKASAIIKKRVNLGVKVARKHICWYFDQMWKAAEVEVLFGQESFGYFFQNQLLTARQKFNQLENEQNQMELLKITFNGLRTTIGEFAA